MLNFAVELCLIELGNDLISLKLCALVHSSWTQIAQYLLFTQTVVRVGRDGALTLRKMHGPITHPATRLHELITESPNVVSFIRIVDYDLADAARCTRTPRLRHRSLMDVLRPMLEIKELRHLRLRNRIPGMKSCKLVTLDLIQARDLSHLHMLTTLELSDAGLRDLHSLQSLICALPTLRNLYFLTFRVYYWTICSRSSESVSSLPVALEHIKIYAGGYSAMEAWRWLFTWLLNTSTVNSLIKFDTDLQVRIPELDEILAAREHTDLEFSLYLRKWQYSE
jgi:hypothetical protein